MFQKIKGDYMWILSQNKKLLTNGNIIFYVQVNEISDDEFEYSIRFKNTTSEDSFKLGQYSSIENCEIILNLILQAVKLSMFDYKLPTNEELEKVKNDKKNKGIK